MARKVEVLSRFLSRYLTGLGADGNGRGEGGGEDNAAESLRQHRARAAFDSILTRLVEAASHLGDPPIGFALFRERLRRAVSSHTFAERSGEGGVQVVDAEAAGFGDFDVVLLLGLNDSEWPAPAERNIFYPLWLLREFGWPSDRELLVGERARFRNLLTLARDRVALFRHQLEDEAPTVPSPFLEDVRIWLDRARGGRGGETIDGHLDEIVLSRREALRRGLLDAPESELPAKGPAGIVDSPPPPPDPVSPTAFELFLRCPFKYYARHLLRLMEEEEVDEALSPLERGRILHDVLQQAFEQWDAGAESPRPVEPETYDEALALFRRVALERIPREHRSVEMARLFGSRGEPGTIEWLLRREMTQPPLRRRLVETAFRTPLRLARGPSGESPWFIRVNGRADRADVDAEDTLHVYDYKSGRAPAPAVTLQVPLYAMCLGQELGVPIREAAYLSFRDRKLTSRMDFQRASERLIDVYRRVRAGRFAPRPYQEHLCASCGYVGLCRKEIDEPVEEPVT